MKSAATGSHSVPTKRFARTRTLTEKLDDFFAGRKRGRRYWVYLNPAIGPDATKVIHAIDLFLNRRDQVSQ